MIRRLSLDFEILHDPANQVAQEYSLRHTLPEDLKALYLSFGIDLAASNGEQSWSLALPARYLVDTQGVVRYRRVNADYTQRPEPQETLEAVQRLLEENN